MEIEQHFRNNSRHDVTEIIIDLILNYISEGVNMNESFILTYAAFLASIYNIIGMEIGNIHIYNIYWNIKTNGFL